MIRLLLNSIFGSAFRKGRVNIVRTFFALLTIALLEFAVFYVTLPAISIYSIEFWVVQGVFTVLFLLFTSVDASIDNKTDYAVGVIRYNVLTIISIVLVIIGIIVVFVGNIASAKIFNANKYASLIEVEMRDFQTDLPEVNQVNDIALMDTEGARVVGQRAIGSLSDVVSQYEISDSYSTIDFNGQPTKVASLEYADFFKWYNNRKTGIPGYVVVDPVKFEAKYKKLNKSIKYTTSGWFNDNLQRHVRFQYPTAIFEGYYFEVDNEGNPYYICPVLKPRVGLFGAKDVSGVVICDPCTGDSKYYDVNDIPNWVDRVYDGELATRKYNWKGILSGGFINSVIGQKDCKMTTNDYGYKVMDGDVWVYTGVTSVIGDQSNVGFILVNARTCQTIYYTIAGAEEYSAMEAAEGQVQNLGYKAAFPSLINIGGQPTYLMVLKDKSNLVKMYAMVNMEKYSIVATGTNQKDTLSLYKKLLKDNGAGTSLVENQKEDIEVADVRYVNVEGETYVYISDTYGNVYKKLFAEDENLIFVKEGDKINVEYEPNENRINNLISFSLNNN
ncbi:MAG: hypothetical protein IKN54_07800 [Lachnospiraceae bacterium]|nr:hypothetical protein [Lachnospiraceae bacterium]